MYVRAYVTFITRYKFNFKFRCNFTSAVLCFVVDEKASFRPRILDGDGVTGWGQTQVNVYLQV